MDLTGPERLSEPQSRASAAAVRGSQQRYRSTKERVTEIHGRL